MCAFVDHGEHGTGEALTLDLRPGKASPHDSADHIHALDAALPQLPAIERGQVLVRADTGACSKALLHHLTDAGLQYSVGFPALDTVKAAVEAIPPQAWRAAMDSDGNPRDGAQVAELTAWMPAPTKPTRSPARFGPQHWPEGMRVIARRERPHPGAQLHLTDHDGWRITCFTTNTRGPRLDTASEARSRSRKPLGVRKSGSYLLGALGEFVQRLTDPQATYGLPLPDNAQFRGLVDRLPQLARDRLNLSIYFVDRGDKTTVRKVR